MAEIYYEDDDFVVEKRDDGYFVEDKKIQKHIAWFRFEMDLANWISLYNE